MAATATDKGAVVEARVAAYKRINAALIKDMNSMIKAQRAANSSLEAFAGGLKAVSTEEQNGGMQELLSSVADALSSSERRRSELIINRYPRTIVGPLTSVAGAAIKPSEKMIADRQAAKISFEKAYAKFNDITSSNGPPAKRVAAERELVDAERRSSNVDHRFVENVDRFEFQRLDEMKRIMEELVHGHMAYHCHALEKLSAAATLLGSFDPALGADELRTQLDKCK